MSCSICNDPGHLYADCPHSLCNRLLYFYDKPLKAFRTLLPSTYFDESKDSRPWVCVLEEGPMTLWMFLTHEEKLNSHGENVRPKLDGNSFDGVWYTAVSYFNDANSYLLLERMEALSIASAPCWENPGDAPTRLNGLGRHQLALYLKKRLRDTDVRTDVRYPLDCHQWLQREFVDPLIRQEAERRLAERKAAQEKETQRKAQLQLAQQKAAQEKEAQRKAQLQLAQQREAQEKEAQRKAQLQLARQKAAQEKAAQQKVREKMAQQKAKEKAEQAALLEKSQKKKASQKAEKNKG